jgi:hypothetical protein
MGPAGPTSQPTECGRRDEDIARSSANLESIARPLVVYVWSARNLAIPSSTARTKARCNDALPAEIEDI